MRNCGGTSISEEPPAEPGETQIEVTWSSSRPLTARRCERAEQVIECLLNAYREALPETRVDLHFGDRVAAGELKFLPRHTATSQTERSRSRQPPLTLARSCESPLTRRQWSRETCRSTADAHARSCVSPTLSEHDRAEPEFWAAIPVETANLQVWKLSEAKWRLSGEFPDEPGLPRSVTRVHRPYRPLPDGGRGAPTSPARASDDARGRALQLSRIRIEE